MGTLHESLENDPLLHWLALAEGVKKAMPGNMLTLTIERTTISGLIVGIVKEVAVTKDEIVVRYQNGNEIRVLRPGD